jgi:DNA-binding winged helix-turn-helix (wHTH) protein
MNAPLPTVVDPRKAYLGGLITAYDLPKAGEKKRWTRMFKAIIARAIVNGVMTPEEACQRYFMTVAELKRWIKLLDTQGLRGLSANNFSDFTAEKLEDVPTFTDGSLTIDFGTQIVKISDKFVHLTKSQLRLVSILIRRAPVAVSREEVYAHLYGDSVRQVKILDVMVCKIRRAIGEDTIETVWGRGWRWHSPELKELEQEKDSMTHLEALVAMSQTMLRVRGEWIANPKLRQDISNVVADIWVMMNIGDDTIIADAIAELERRVPR